MNIFTVHWWKDENTGKKGRELPIFYFLWILIRFETQTEELENWILMCDDGAGSLNNDR